MFFRLPFSLLLLCALWHANLNARQYLDTSAAPQNPTASVRWFTMFENMPRDWARWADVSFRPERTTEWWWITGSTLFLIVTDDITYTPSEKFYKSSSSSKYWSDLSAEIGDGRTQFALAGGFAAYGLLFDDQKALRTGSQIVEAVLASGAIIQVMKHVTGRESPFVRSEPTGRWVFFPNQIDYHHYVPYYDAFPSGHICTSLATVVVIAENYPDNKWVRPVGYTLTTLVGLGMLANGIHWLSDYPLGLFVGYYVGMIAAHPEGWGNDVSASPEGIHWRVVPVVNTTGAGIGLHLQF